MTDFPVSFCEAPSGPAKTRASLQRRCRAFGLFCAAALLATGLAAADKRADKQVLRIGTFSATIVSAAWAQTVAHDQILRETLARLGYTLELKNYPNSPAIAAAFAAREIDAGPQTEITLFQSVADADATVVGLVGISYVAVVARTAAEPRDLVGARVAVVPKTVGDLALARMQEAAGLKEGQIHRVELPVAAMQTTLEKGEVDAFSMWEPTPQRTLRAHPEYRVLFRNASPTVLVMRNDLLRSHPEVARALAAGYLRAFRWWGIHDGNLLKAVSWALSEGDTKAAAEQVQAAQLEGIRTMHGSVTGVLGLPLLPQGWTTEEGEARQRFDFLQRIGWLPPVLQWNDVRKRFDRSMLQSILKEAGRYRLEEFRYE